ncbi:MAG: hypothetical protein IKT39_03795, partial [Clostridia bacterium]|nr:hypothetical protein [Clostridia bacterium]
STIAKTQSLSPKQHQHPFFSTTPNGTAGRCLTALEAFYDTSAFSCFNLFRSFFVRKGAPQNLFFHAAFICNFAYIINLDLSSSF